MSWEYKYKDLSERDHVVLVPQPKGRMKKEQELIAYMLNALKLTKYDAEREGFKYGAQSNVVKAIKRAEDYVASKS